MQPVRQRDNGGALQQQQQQQQACQHDSADEGRGEGSEEPVCGDVRGRQGGRNGEGEGTSRQSGKLRQAGQEALADAGHGVIGSADGSALPGAWLVWLRWECSGARVRVRGCGGSTSDTAGATGAAAQAAAGGSANAAGGLAAGLQSNCSWWVGRKAAEQAQLAGWQLRRQSRCSWRVGNCSSAAERDQQRLPRPGYRAAQCIACHATSAQWAWPMYQLASHPAIGMPGCNTKQEAQATATATAAAAPAALCPVGNTQGKEQDALLVGVLVYGGGIKGWACQHFNTTAQAGGKKLLQLHLGQLHGRIQPWLGTGAAAANDAQS